MRPAGQLVLQYRSALAAPLLPDIGCPPLPRPLANAGCESTPLLSSSTLALKQENKPNASAGFDGFPTVPAFHLENGLSKVFNKVNPESVR